MNYGRRFVKTVCIVQARMGSTRLPGKVLLPLNGHTVIGEVLSRCKRIPGVDEVVCATPDVKIAQECNRLGFVWHNGAPEADVLGRYYAAAVEHRADIIMRITGDCPLIGPELCGEVLGALKRTWSDYEFRFKADYASNIMPRTFPKGFDCEAFTRGTLERAHWEAKEPYDREHVTSWMQRADIKRANVASPWPMDGRLTLDTEDDYKVICAAFGHEPYQRLRAA
jgi:spore coat polysaccharide biosynthesis protein SpsF